MALEHRYFLFFVLFWKKSCSLLYADVWPAKNVPCVVFACIFEDTLWGPRPGWGGYIIWPWQLWFIDDKSRQVLLIVLTTYACWWKVAKTNIWPQCFHAKNCTCRFLKFYDLSDIIFFRLPIMTILPSRNIWNYRFVDLQFYGFIPHPLKNPFRFTFTTEWHQQMCENCENPLDLNFCAKTG